MKTHKPLLACLLLAVATCGAAPVLSTEFRYASQLNEWFVRGDAAVSTSPVFDGGLRLAAWDERDPQAATRVAVATGVYFFQVPQTARSLRIEASYRVAPEATDKRVAGFIFLRNAAVEREYARKYQLQATPAEEPTFYGHSYLLPADQVVMTLDIPTTDYVVDGVLEVHLSAGAGQVLDVLYIKVTAFGEAMPVGVEQVSSALYVPNPYQYTYIYYYAGPWYYPRGGRFVSFWCFDDTLDPFWWDGWVSFRACFFAYHPWVYRPVYYVHRPLLVFSPRIYRPIIVHHCGYWYQRHFGVTVLNFGDPSLRYIVRRPRRYLPRELADRRRHQALLVAENVRFAGYELRSRLGPSFRDRLRQWHRDPADLRRHLDSVPRSAQIKRASLEWKTIFSGHRPTPPQRVSLPTPTRSPVLRTPRPRTPTRPVPSIIKADPAPGSRPRIIIPTLPRKPEPPSRPRPNVCPASPPSRTTSRPTGVSPPRVSPLVRGQPTPPQPRRPHPQAKPPQPQPKPPQRSPQATAPRPTISFPLIRTPHRVYDSPRLPQPATPKTRTGAPRPTLPGPPRTASPSDGTASPTRKPPEPPRRTTTFPPSRLRSLPVVGPRRPEPSKPRPPSVSPTPTLRPPTTARPTATVPPSRPRPPTLRKTTVPTLRPPSRTAPWATEDKRSSTTSSRPRYVPRERYYPTPQPARPSRSSPSSTPTRRPPRRSR